MVPPMFWILFCSAIKSMTGSGVYSLISVECASVNPMTLRANSMTAHCMPKQIPKKGTPFVRAYWMVSILPSTPLEPKPGATMIPSRPANFSAALLDAMDSL